MIKSRKAAQELSNAFDDHLKSFNIHSSWDNFEGVEQRISELFVDGLHLDVKNNMTRPFFNDLEKAIEAAGVLGSPVFSSSPSENQKD